jgi:hypothetical protein
MKLFRFVISFLLIFSTSSAFASTVLYTEKANMIRFEQYTGVNAGLALWRLSSTFPLQDGSAGPCRSLTIPVSTASITLGNRFLSLYMFVKTNDLTYFVQYDTTTCTITSFGMDG